MYAQRLEKSAQAEKKFGQVSVPTPERSIGCGVCVYTCPVEALTLEPRDVSEDPPKNVHEFATHLMSDWMRGG